MRTVRSPYSITSGRFKKCNMNTPAVHSPMPLIAHSRWHNSWSLRPSNMDSDSRPDTNSSAIPLMKPCLLRLSPTFLSPFLFTPPHIASSEWARYASGVKPLGPPHASIMRSMIALPHETLIIWNTTPLTRARNAPLLLSSLVEASRVGTQLTPMRRIKIRSFGSTAQRCTAASSSSFRSSTRGPSFDRSCPSFLAFPSKLLSALTHGAAVAPFPFPFFGDGDPTALALSLPLSALFSSFSLPCPSS
mmetsp:Transcript_18889/g.45393  ORF Transcript_18889/g.45393 Transcript_18889/m.45393 type:complete len:247 (-) Transcript_18889:200-940(-)